MDPSYRREKNMENTISTAGYFDNIERGKQKRETRVLPVSALDLIRTQTCAI